MSGLVVRPGDTLFLPVQPPSHLTPAERDVVKQEMERYLPGVLVIVMEGVAPVPFVYRPGDR